MKLSTISLQPVERFLEEMLVRASLQLITDIQVARCCQPLRHLTKSLTGGGTGDTPTPGKTLPSRMSLVTKQWTDHSQVSRQHSEREEKGVWGWYFFRIIERFFGIIHTQVHKKGRCSKASIWIFYEVITRSCCSGVVEQLMNKWGFYMEKLEYIFKSACSSRGVERSETLKWLQLTN